MSSYRAYESGANRFGENDILKKVVLVLILVGFMLLMVVTAALAEDGKVPDLPAQIAAAFDENSTIEDAIEIDGTPSGNYYFTITTQDGQKHTLTWFLQIGDEWKKLGKSSVVLPYGRGTILIKRHTVSSNAGWYSDGETMPFNDAWGFSIYRIDPEHEEYYMQTLEIHYIGHEFQVVGWQDRSKSTEHGYVSAGHICYYDPNMGGKVKSVPLYATFSLQSSFASLPKCYQDAKKEYSAPPKIPQGEISGKRVKFVPNQVIPVYQGPGENYSQAGAGKAVVSTNDWVQVFGMENGWAMIQYDITSDHMRIGWIAAEKLPDAAKVDSFVWNMQAAMVSLPCVLTDDPLFSQAEIISLEAGAEVLKLGQMGDWAYIEYGGLNPVRGFVRAENLAMIEDVEEEPCGNELKQQ